ncbi:MAG: ABC transporter permease [Nitrospiraceae bacterium]|nr:ABC transporter permease [Nitrospiraceae bacterium]
MTNKKKVKSRNLGYFKDLAIILTQKEMKVRYKNSFLGYLWSVLNPLAFAFVFFVAFQVVMKIHMKDYVLFLIAGLFPWQNFTNSINASPMVFLMNSTLIKKVNFPRHILALTLVLHDSVHFVLSIPVILFFMFVYHRVPSLSLVWGVPALLSVQILMTYGIALFLASLNLFFRDLERLTTILTTALFYFTPVIYSETMVPDKYRVLLKLNPFAMLMISWRNLFLNGSINPVYAGAALGYGILFFCLGYFFYSKLAWKFAEVL